MKRKIHLFIGGLIIGLSLITINFMQVQAEDKEPESQFSFYEEDIQYLHNELDKLFDEITT